MSLRYEPSSEPLHNSAKYFLNREPQVSMEAGDDVPLEILEAVLPRDGEGQVNPRPRALYAGRETRDPGGWRGCALRILVYFVTYDSG